MGLPKSRGGMGFRDFIFFNKALLAKQCWQLWNKPDTLVSRIMTAKYYANSSILEAKLGNKPSYAWRSISLFWVHVIFFGRVCFGELGMGKRQRYGEINGSLF